MSAGESRFKRTTKTTPLGSQTLTNAEMEVLSLILDGKSNKETAHLLHRSVRTVEDHRCHIMHKLGVNNPVDLVKKAAAMGLIDLQTDK
jgi:DNA-binding NarL/FixJ family response regulator